MTTQQIKIFLEAAKQMNFTAAAERLFITQPTLSRQISILENELNTKLFNRVNNNVTLTPAGEVLMHEFSHIDEQIDQLRFRISSINCGFTGSLRIAVSREQVIPELLREAIGVFCSEYPEIEIVMRRMEAGEIFEGVFNCTLDVGINSRCNQDIDTFAAKLDMMEYEEQSECLAIRKDFVAELGDSLTLDQCAEVIREHPLYMPSISTFNNPLKDFENDAYFMREQKHMATPQRLYRLLDEDRRLTDYRFVRSMDAVFLSVECGLGCTLTDRGSVLSINPNVKLIPLTFPENEPYEPIRPVVIYNHNNSNPTTGNFLEVIRSLL